MRRKADTATVLRRIVASIPYQQDSGDKLQGKEWRWVEGVHVFPEAICPMCNVVMRSSCLWQINNRAGKLVKVVGVVKRKLVNLPILHPHANSDGYVCTGSSRMGGVAQALFMGMNPRDTMPSFRGAWERFFYTYFTGHVHAEKKKRRPSLELVEEAVRKAPLTATVRAKPRKRA